MLVGPGAAQRDQAFELNESQHNLLPTAALRICNSLYGRVVDDLRGQSDRPKCPIVYWLAPAFPRYRERWDLTGTLCYSQHKKQRLLDPTRSRCTKDFERRRLGFARAVVSGARGLLCY